MTVVTYKDGVMAADSCSFSGGRRYPSTGPKIVRGPHGLLGAAGRDSDCWLAKEWFKSGMPPEKPLFSDDKDEPIHLMWVQLNSSVWWSDGRLVFTPLPEPHTIGQSTAIDFVEGALLAGASAADAVALGIQHCVWIGGDVQAERLDDVYPSKFHRVAAAVQAELERRQA